MKLDIGCGGRGTKHDGFIGIDIWPCPVGHEDKYVQLDFVADGLPWDNNTVDEIICLHMIEHLTREGGVEMVKRAYRLLKPGCIMTITCPDLGVFCQAYIDEDLDFFRKKHINGGKEIWPGLTMGDRFNWAIHQDGHKWSYDLKTLYTCCYQAGLEKHELEVMGKDDKYCTRPDHEIGVKIKKGGWEQ